MCRLSYKLSSAREYTTIERDPPYFKCARGIASSGDYCYDLTDFDRGVQYTSEVSYLRRDGTWSDGGNPLFFILVEAGMLCVTINRM
jgi:hypothetical protein